MPRRHMKLPERWARASQGFGYDVIGPLSDYTKLCSDVEYLDSSSFDPANYSGKVTLVPKPVV